MKKFFKSLCCCLRCCKCCGYSNPLEDIDETTLMYPNKGNAIEMKNEVFLFGLIALSFNQFYFELDHFSQFHIQKVSLGENHALFLTADGRLFGYGSNQNGQLGFPMKEESSLNNYYQLESVDSLGKNTKVVDIATGDKHSIVLTDELNGTKIYKFVYTPENLGDRQTTMHEMNFDFEQDSIKNIFACGKRSLIVSTSNCVFVNGIDFSETKIPTTKLKKLKHQFKSQVKYIALGNNHALVLGNSNELSVIGNNSYGELGLSALTFTASFVANEYFVSLGRIRRIATGARHSLVLLDTGELYCMGDNSDSQCFGLADRYRCPTVVNYFFEDTISDIKCGYNSSLCLLKNGKLYTWGDSTEGKTGHYETRAKTSKPTEVIKLAGRKISSVSLGEHSMIIATSEPKNSLATYDSI